MQPCTRFRRGAPPRPAPRPAPAERLAVDPEIFDGRVLDGNGRPSRSRADRGCPQASGRFRRARAEGSGPRFGRGAGGHRRRRQAALGQCLSCCRPTGPMASDRRYRAQRQAEQHPGHSSTQRRGPQRNPDSADIPMMDAISTIRGLTAPTTPWCVCAMRNRQALAGPPGRSGAKGECRPLGMSSRQTTEASVSFVSDT